MAKASPAQLAARAKFAAAARSGKLAKSRKTARKKAPAKKAVKRTRTVCVAREMNPIRQRITYKVQVRNNARSIWQTVVTTSSEKESRATAKMLHAAYPTRAYRVIDNSDD